MAHDGLFVKGGESGEEGGRPKQTLTMNKSIKQHDITYTTSIAKRAAANVTHFLQTVWPQTVAVHNVEDDAAYQAHDVDLLWTVLEKEQLRVIPVEVKGDRYHRTGNFFFETVSNESKDHSAAFSIRKPNGFFTTSWRWARFDSNYPVPVRTVFAGQTANVSPTLHHSSQTRL